MHNDILLELEAIKQQLSEHDHQIMLVLEYLKQFAEARQQEFEQKEHPRIGFKTGKE